jgi:thiol-disulfide isomerase/thioredoxin
MGSATEDGKQQLMKRVFVAGMALALLVAVLSGCSAEKPAAPHAVAPLIRGQLLPSLPALPAQEEASVELGSYAPDFTLISLDGETVTLSELRGSTVVLNFWASWCAPCRYEMPLLQATYEAYGADGLVVLAVNLGEERRRVEGFAEDMLATFPVFGDEETRVGTLYRVRGVPTTYFIDRDGVVRQRYVGELTAGILGSILRGEMAYPNS